MGSSAGGDITGNYRKKRIEPSIDMDVSWEGFFTDGIKAGSTVMLPIKPTPQSCRLDIYGLSEDDFNGIRVESALEHTSEPIAWLPEGATYDISVNSSIKTGSSITVFYKNNKLLIKIIYE